MAEVLSQSEIDALLDAVSAGEVTESPIAPPPVESPKGNAVKGLSVPDWIAYDLLSHEKFVRGKLAALEGIHDRFARYFRLSLSKVLKRNVTVNYLSTDFLKFEDYLNTILLPTSINIFSIKSPPGYMMAVFGTRLAYSIVDAYYGGTERPFSKIGGKDEFTQIENNIILKVAKLASKDLQEAWKLNYPIQLDFSRMESNPGFVGSISSAETVGVANFEVEMEHLSGQFVVIVQLRALDPIQNYLTANVSGELPIDKRMWKNHWLRELATMELNAKVVVGQSDKTLGQIRGLKSGQEIILEQDAASPLSVHIEGIPKFKGTMGVRRGSTAIRVTEILPIKTRSE